MFRILAAFVAAFMVSHVSAEVSLPTVMASNMVLQQGRDVPLWGWAEPGESVSVEFAGQKKTVKADKSGSWMVTLDSMKASAEPRDLKIGSLTLSNVLVGEVWICSGQSNMEYGFRGDGTILKTDMLRMYRVEGHVKSTLPNDNAKGAWNSFGDGNSRGFSGVGLFFGCKLQKELGVPIGLIDSSWGGSPIEGWISDEGYELMGAPIKKDMAALLKQQEKIIQDVSDWVSRAEGSLAAGKIIPLATNAKLDLRVPNEMYNGMIAPVVPYGIKGAIWYQGESNRGKGYPDYFKKLQGLVGGWQKVFNAPDMPFYQVQIAPYDYNRGKRSEKDQTLANNIWATQYKAAAEIKNCGVIPTHDTIAGNVKDIHPSDKKPVGERLAALALHKTYGKDVVFSGPVFKSAAASDGKVVVSFDMIDQGLETADGKAPTWFELSADDKTYVAADAVIEGKTVVVSSANLAEPKFVRMGWNEIAIPTLRDKNGWPAFQFQGTAVE